MLPPDNRQHLPGLDGIRALCVTAVLFVHMQNGYHLWKNEWLAGLFLRGWYGVDVFFVLSGFLITWILLKEVDRTGTIDLKRFYQRRALRLMPAYVTALVLTVIQKKTSFPAGYQQMLHALPFFLTYTLNEVMAGGHFQGIPLGIAWSLCIEEQFYLFWPWLLRWIGARHASVFAVSAIVSICIYRNVLYVWMNRGHLSTPGDASFLRIYLSTETRIDVIFTGCLLALLFRAPRFRRVWSFLSSHKSTPWVASLIFVALVAWGTTGTPSQASVRSATIGYTVMALATGGLLTGVLLHPQSRLVSWLSFGPVAFVGRISYGFYLFHILAAGFVMHVLSVSESSRLAPKLLVLVMAWLAAVAVSAAHYFAVEKRFLRLRPRESVGTAVRLPAAPNLS